MNIKKIVAGTSAVALSLTITSFALAAQESNNIQLEVNVQETLSMDCYDTAGGTGDTTVTLGTAATPGVVVAGTPAVGGSTCNVTTNDDNGYYLTLVNAMTNNNGATAVLQHDDPNLANTTYDISPVGLTAYDWSGTVATGSPSVRVKWDTANPTGLGFSVISVDESNHMNDFWTGAVAGATCPETSDTTNDYAGIPTAAGAEAIAAVEAYTAATTTTNVCYKVDVTAVQESGDYSGTVTYTATTDASTLN